MYHYILLLLTAASLATAMPVANHVPRDLGASGIPDGTTHLSYNDQTGQITAYNGASILRQYNASDPTHQPDRRDDATGSCVPVSEAEVQALKGWSKLEAAADSAWGKGSRKVVTNPPDYTWGPANACTDGETKVQFDSSKPSCDVQKSTQKAKWDKASGVATVSITNGIDQETSYTVTKENSIGVGASISATIGVPDIASVSTQYTVDVKFTNTQSQASSSSDSSSVTHTETVNGGNNQCSVDLTVNSCHATGTASIRTSVTGYVWFNYDSKTASADGDPDDKHYKWALSIENTLTDINDRSDTMELKTSTKGSSHATAETSCNKVAS